MDSPRSIDQMRPPTRSVASSITTSSTPSLMRRLAAATAEIPAPMITTRGDLSISPKKRKSPYTILVKLNSRQLYYWKWIVHRTYNANNQTVNFYHNHLPSHHHITLFQDKRTSVSKPYGFLPFRVTTKTGLRPYCDYLCSLFYIIKQNVIETL